MSLKRNCRTALIPLLGLMPLASHAVNLAYDKPAPTVHPKLTAHSQTMEQRVEKITDGVYKAIGYDIANSVMIVGDEGTVIVDVLSTVDTATQVSDAFREITDLPTKALIYTHHHGDHINGSPAFIKANGGVKPRIFAHETLMKNLAQQAGMLVPITASRAFFMYGNYLEKGPEGLVNTGIGPALVTGKTQFVPPTDLVKDVRRETIAGIEMEMVYVPSEALDEIAVWFPQKKVLHVGEVLQGESFPNIYTIRGDVMRDPMEWVRAIDRLRQYPAEVMVRSHGRAIVGKENVAATLTAYRDAIQYVHDQTVRYINKGYSPDELVTIVNELPPHLKDDPNLQEFYGTVKHAVRAIYNQYIGWFNGDPATLDPLPPVERAERYVSAMGGRKAVLSIADKALKEKDYRWAAEVASYLITLDTNDKQARQIKADAFRPLAFEQINVNWRNFYLSAAEEMEGSAPRALGASARGIAFGLPAPIQLQHMAVRIDAKRAQDTELSGAFITPRGQRFGLEIRRGIAQFHPKAPAKVDFEIRWQQRGGLAYLSTGMETLDALVKSKRIQLSGDQKKAEQFFSLFDRPTPWHNIPVTLPAAQE